MKEIRFTGYFMERLKFRKISENVPIEVLKYAEHRFYDRETGRFVAVKNVKITKRRSQKFMVAYEEHADYLLAITIHTITTQQLNERVKVERWIKQ
jgi:polyhydroxyalkanoate synthesis regulator protein